MSVRICSMILWLVLSLAASGRERQLPDWKVEISDCGQIYLVVGENVLNRELMLTAQINRGAGLRNRSLPAAGVVLLQPTTDHRMEFFLCKACPQRLADAGTVTGDLPELALLRAPAFECSAERQGEHWRINITKWLLRDGDWYRCEGAGVKAEREGQAVFTDWMLLPDGICFNVRRFFEPESELDGFQGSSGVLPVDISLVLSFLPEEGPLVFPDGVASLFRKIPCLVYRNCPPETVVDSLPVHWHLPPCHPLTLYVDSDVPAYYERLLMEEVAIQNQYRQQKGIPVKLELKRISGECPAALPFVFSYDDGRAGVSCHTLEHPATGQILSVRLNMGGRTDPRKVMRYRLERALNDSCACFLTESEAREGYIRTLLSDGIFRALGMRTSVDRQDAPRSADTILLFSATVRVVACKAFTERLETEWCSKCIPEKEKELQAFYRELLSLLKEEYEGVIAFFQQTCNVHLQREAFEWLYRQLIAEQEGEYAPGFLKRNLLLPPERMMAERCAKVWTAFFDPEIWLRAGREGPNRLVQSVLPVLQSAFLAKSLPSPAEMRVALSCVSAFGALCNDLNGEPSGNQTLSRTLLVKEYASLQTSLNAFLEKQMRKSSKRGALGIYRQLLQEQLNLSGSQ